MPPHRNPVILSGKPRTVCPVVVSWLASLDAFVVQHIPLSLRATNLKAVANARDVVQLIVRVACCWRYARNAYIFGWRRRAAW